jgi:DNA-binding NarL/FixJ family response regulator
VIETQPDLRVVGDTSDGAQAVKLAGERTPDILLVDLAIPGLMGLEVLRKVQCLAPWVRTVVLAAKTQMPETIEAIKIGARGVLPKDSPADLLLKAIRSVIAGQLWVGREKIADILQSFGNGASAPPNSPLGNNFLLTSREIQIISRILQTESNKDIAKKFGISENTVKHHLTHVFDKLGVCNRLELALLVVNCELLGRWSAEHLPHPSARLTLVLNGIKTG